VLYAPQMVLAGPLPKAAGQQAPKGVSQVQVPAQVAQRAPERLAAKTGSQSAKILKRRRKDGTCATVAA
jgi:antitoxin component HigA of HigAB toxin-antitoxin module